LLVRPGTTVALRPKTLAVLLLLLRRAGEVVSKDEIIATVWENAAVSDYVLTTCISELRAALGERPKHPRYLKTVHRSGYQLVIDARDGAAGIPDPSSAGTAAPIVGREAELAKLAALARLAAAGQRQIVFLTGEMGIGKTTLADELVRMLAQGGEPTNPLPPTLVARGQCIEQFGTGEPYMPLFEAIARLGRSNDSQHVVEVLRRHAPTWLIQIPGLLPPEQRAELRRELPAATQEHMLRTIADGIEALGEDRLFVLLLEDLHLSDRATLELVMTLALRRGPSRLLLIGTFRSAEAYAASAAFVSLKQNLLLHRQCEEIALKPLTRQAVDTYLVERFAGLRLPPAFASTIHDRTEGNPLFIARLVDQWLDDGVLKPDVAESELRIGSTDLAHHVPANLRAMIEQRADSLDATERQVLETASVAGVQFWSSAVASALGRSREEVEALCTRLSRHHGFLKTTESSTSAPPALGMHYEFRHSLYQQTLYERVEISRRQRLHGDIGIALRSTWGERATEVAAELASHFERAGDLTHAIEFYDQAAVVAVGRGANREAVRYLDRALALLAQTDTAERPVRQLDLLMTRGPSVLASAGYGSAEVLDNYHRALDLARQVADPIREISSLLALSICEQTRANLELGESYALELVRVAGRVGLPPPFIAQLHNPLSQVRLHQGAIGESLALADAAVAAMEVMAMPPPPPDSRPALWAEPRVMLHCQRAAASFALGRLSQAGTAVDQAMAIARELNHPFNLAYACCYASLFEDTMGRWQPAIQLARQAIEITHAYEFPFWEGVAQIFAGHALARSGDPEGLSLMHAGIALWRSTGGRLATTMHLDMLADACLAANDVDGAQAALAEACAHAERSGEKLFLAETWRLQAECQRRSQAAPAASKETLQRAIAMARQQGTKLWELRSTLALYHLDRSELVRRDLATICRAFDGEPETPDLIEARLLTAGGAADTKEASEEEKHASRPDTCG